MDTQGVEQETFDFFAQKPIIVEPAEAYLSTDAGLLPIRRRQVAIAQASSPRSRRAARCRRSEPLYQLVKAINRRPD